MKKNWILLIGILIIILLGFFLFFSLNKKDDSKLIPITGQELLDKLNQKETFILVFTQDGCSHCNEYTPILNRVLDEYDITIYDLNLTELRKDTELYNQVSSKFNIPGTPTTIFINDGEEKTTLNRLVGGSNYKDLVEKFKDRGFIE